MCPPLGNLIDLIIFMAGVVSRAGTGVGLSLPDARAGLGSSGAFGLEGRFLVLICGFGLLEDVDDVLALLEQR